VIRPGDRSLDTITRALREPSDAERRVIAIDQFEEIFTGGADDDARTSVLDAITHAASVPEGDTTIVVAMRADFYGRCAEHRGFASLLASGQILVGPMDSEEVRRAIELPAERTALRLDAGLADALVSDTVGQPGALPLLSTALLELWVHRRDGLLSLDDYRRGGGVEGAVARLGEEAYARLDAAEQAAAKRILLRLAAQGEGAEVVRRRAPLGEFDLDRDADAAHAMDVLADARLVTVSEGSAEVAHEALLREWPRLRAWLDDDAEGRRLHRHVTDASQTWDEGGRDPADLYRGARLTATWDWAEPHVADLNDLERAFLGASRAASEGEAARTRRTNRRLRGLLAGVAALLVVALVIGDVALTQRDRARQALTVADAQRLAARSRLEADPQLALLIARESVNIDDSAETRSALFSALERAPAISARIASPTGPSTVGDETQWIAMAPGTQTIAIGDASDTVEVFDAVQRASIGTVDVGAGTQRGAFSPDGKTLTVVTSHGNLVNIDVATQAVDAHVAAGFVDAMAYAPDGSRLLTAEARPHLKELLVPRDPRTLQPSGPAIQTDAGQPQVSPLSSFAMAFSPDGSLVTTRASDRGKRTIQWNADLKPIRRFTFAGNTIAMSPNGRTAAIIGNTGEGSSDTQTQVAFLDIRSGASRVTSIHHGASASTQFEILGADFSPDGRTLVTAGNDQQLSIWNVATASISRSLTGAGVPLRGPVLSADGSTAFTTDRNREVVVWDLSGRESFVRPFTAGSGFGQWPYFAESPDGRTLATTSVGSKSRPSVALIDTSNLEIVRRITDPGSLPLGLAFSPNSSTLAVGSANRNQYFVRLWDVATGRPASANLPGIEGTQVWSLAFSPSGDMLAGGGPLPDRSRGRTYLWDLTNGARLVGHVDTEQTVDQVSFTPDGSELTAATGQSTGGDLVTWNAQTLASLLNVRVDNVGVYSSDVSNDGRAIVTGGQAGPRLWDIATGAPLGPPMTGLNGLPGTVDISADGTTVVGADESGNVLLWDVATGTPLGDPLPGPAPSRWMAALFSPDGRRLFVVSDAGQGWVWDVDQSDWLTRACTVAGRNLTLQEWQQLLPGQPYEATCGF
jgi:WD40 repeat protein